MLENIRRFFAAPVFEDNEEKSTKAYLLNFITITYLLIAVVTVVAALSANANEFQQTMRQALTRSLPMVIIMVGTQILMRSGRVTAATIFFSASLWLQQTYDIFTNGGVTSPMLFMYILSVMLIGLLIGRQYAIVGAIVSFVMAVIILVIENQGLLPAPMTEQSVTNSLFSFFFVIFLSTSLLYLYGTRLDESTQKMRDANLALEKASAQLEGRVADRTKDLEIVAEVGTTVATIQETKRLLPEVVDLTKERFNLYHSHIYLLDEEGKNLVLAAGAGEPGRIMVSEGRSIPLDREQSLVARAARERKGVTVNDVTQAPDFLPNPLLPDTHSELAVPMIVGGNVIGVFDIQSDQVGRFTDSDVNIQTTLAAQLAVSIQNVRSFEQSRKQAELESLVNVIGQKIQHTTTMEDTLQTAIRELGTAIGASRVKAHLQKASTSIEVTPVKPTELAFAAEVERKNGSSPSDPESTLAE